MSVDALMMVTDDCRNVVIRRDFPENALTDGGVFLHPPPLFKSQWAFLTQEARWEADFANVVHEPAEERPLALFRG